MILRSPLKGPPWGAEVTPPSRECAGFLESTWAALSEAGREVCSRPWADIPRTESPGFAEKLLGGKHKAKTFRH